MPDNYSSKSRPNAFSIESILSAVSVGVFFIIIGVIFIIHLPFNLWDSLISFFSSFIIVPVSNTGLLLPAPSNPAAFSELYLAVFQFCIATGIFNAVMLILRVWFNSPIDKKAETVGNIVFWLSTGYLITVYLTSSANLLMWFIFWTWVLMVLGWSFIARAFVYLAKRAQSKT